MFLLPNRNLTFSKDFIFHLSLFCIFICFFIIFIGIDTKYGKHNIINAAWSDEINGTEQADIITGTAKQDIIKGFYGNDALSGKEAGITSVVEVEMI
jgi:Ca2+-binding RTX toxin-like protein